jgi:hypothetical protein
MKTLILILWVVFLLVNVVAVIEDPNDPFQTALEEFLARPDFAYQSEVWTLDDSTWDVRPCAHLVYFVGPLALEDRTDCALPWAVTTR